MDGAHPSEGMMQMPLISTPGTFSKLMDANMPYACWIGFNQVMELPEQLLVPYVATNIQVEGILDSGHYLFEEKREQVLKLVFPF
ncbi:hypothetical protein [uncultured Algoriphagus sp.]|uniref:hypothetical protein n=1 Tax=uncultured Algoriphagus sp. TaxID=417365 RepID=UPI0030EBAD40